MSQPLFDALDVIGAQLVAAPHALIVVDFDGTLNPIVSDPRTVYLSHEMAETLRSLGAHPRVTVALVSGRDRADLQARALVPGLVYIGNHGLDISGPGLLFVEPGAAASRVNLQGLAQDLQNRLALVEGILVEDKGLTASVHYRMVAPEARENVRQQVHAALANASHPFQLNEGDLVYEIRPRSAWNKASAVTWVQEQLAKPGLVTLYMGDNPTDEEAFAKLPEGITIRVGPDPLTVAAYQVAGPDEARRFLAWLDNLLKSDAAHEPVIAPMRS